MDKKEIAKKIYVVCIKILSILHTHGNHDWDRGFDRFIYVSGYLSRQDDKDAAKELISGVGTIYGGMGSFADGGYGGEYDKLRDELPFLIDKLEDAYGLSPFVGEYTVDKAGKVNYKWFCKNDQKKTK